MNSNIFLVFTFLSGVSYISHPIHLVFIIKLNLLLHLQEIYCGKTDVSVMLNINFLKKKKVHNLLYYFYYAYNCCMNYLHYLTHLMIYLYYSVWALA